MKFEKRIEKRIEEAKADLKACWREQIEEGWISHTDMLESLKMQIEGIEDLSLDELTEERAESMGWNYESIMNDECEELNAWKNIVVEAALEFINE